MGAVKEVTISLPREMLAELEAAVEAGEFTDTSDAIRDAVRSWHRSRTVIAASNAELTRLREKYARLAAGLRSHR